MFPIFPLQVATVKGSFVLGRRVTSVCWSQPRARPYTSLVCPVSPSRTLDNVCIACVVTPLFSSVSNFLVFFWVFCFSCSLWCFICCWSWARVCGFLVYVFCQSLKSIDQRDVLNFDFCEYELMYCTFCYQFWSIVGLCLRVGIWIGIHLWCWNWNWNHQKEVLDLRTMPIYARWCMLINIDINAGQSMHCISVCWSPWLIFDKSKNQNFSFGTSKVKKTSIYTSILYLWVYMPQDLKFWHTDPKFCGELESEVRSGFRVRNKELKVSGVLGSEGITLRSGVLDQN